MVFLAWEGVTLLSSVSLRPKVTDTW